MQKNSIFFRMTNENRKKLRELTGPSIRKINTTTSNYQLYVPGMTSKIGPALFVTRRDVTRSIRCKRFFQRSKQIGDVTGVAIHDAPWLILLEATRSVETQPNAAFTGSTVAVKTLVKHVSNSVSTSGRLVEGKTGSKPQFMTWLLSVTVSPCTNFRDWTF